jgi:hypothetical protein
MLICWLKRPLRKMRIHTLMILSLLRSKSFRVDWNKKRAEIVIIFIKKTRKHQVMNIMKPLSTCLLWKTQVFLTVVKLSIKKSVWVQSFQISLHLMFNNLERKQFKYVIHRLFNETTKFQKRQLWRAKSKEVKIEFRSYQVWCLQKRLTSLLDKPQHSIKYIWNLILKAYSKRFSILKINSSLITHLRKILKMFLF